jgi:hypothetical protein
MYLPHRGLVACFQRGLKSFDDVPLKGIVNPNIDDVARFDELENA